MARSTTKALAAAASAARRALGRDETPASAAAPGSAAPPEATAPAQEAATRKTPATKAATKKTATRKTPATKAATTKTATKKTATKKTATTKATTSTVATKAPAQEAAATKAAARKTSPQKTAPTKKAPVKKTPAASAAPQAPADTLVVQEGEEAWTPAELQEVVTELHQQRDHSLQIIDDQSEELTGLLRDSGDGAGHDQADVGATSFERDHELTVLNSERDKIAQIERALGRIDDASYGQCESCGQPIGKMRLMAFPRATLCLTCKQREERR